jgi:SAM-dependent methyltransferase
LPRYDEVVDFSPPGWLDIYDDAVSRASFDLLEPLEDVRILDLACRHGRMSREIARRCAGVVGRDLSEKRIDKARAIDAIEPLDISYLNGDAAGPSILPGQAFDGVVSSFGLSDIDDSMARLRLSGECSRQRAGSFSPVYIPVLAGVRMSPDTGRAPAAITMMAGGWPTVRSRVSVGRRAPTAARCRRPSTCSATTVSGSIRSPNHGR